MFTVDWSNLKTFIVSRSLSIQYIELSDSYLLAAVDGAFTLDSVIAKSNPRNPAQIDFEDNFKANGNKKLETRDSDGSLLNRVKITASGWHYQLHGLEIETAKLNSTFSKKVDGTDYGFSTIKFYKDISGVETEITGEDLNQTYLDANCVKTIVDWEPTHDLEIIGGSLKQLSIPNDDIRLWVIGVPDVPEIAGGSKAFVTSVNLKYMGLEEGIKVDGRSPKYLQYTPYHTTKIRLMLRHSVGFKHKINMIFELFKA